MLTAVSNPFPLARRLRVGALGFSLVLLVSVAWGSALLYLVVRLALPAPVNLALADAVHVSAGLAGVVYFAAKISRVRLQHWGAGAPRQLLWQRWISWALALLYGAIFLTGGFLLLPIRGHAYDQLRNAHLLTSVWAVPLTAWHVWHYRVRALSFLPRWPAPRIDARYWAGVLVTLVPIAWFALAPRAVSELTQLRGYQHATAGWWFLFCAVVLATAGAGAGLTAVKTPTVGRPAAAIKTRADPAAGHPRRHPAQ